MTKWIAETAFDCTDPKGKRFRAAARIGTPRTVPREGKLAAHGVCPMSLRPLLPEREIGGVDQFQALCLALHLVRRALKTFVAQGGHVFFPGSDTPIDLDDPSFCPHLDFEWFNGRKQEPARRKARRR